MKQEKGITLIALMVTIIVMIIIASIAIKTGLDSLDETELQGFYTQLDIVQKKVDEIVISNENYNLLGIELTSTQKSNLQNILNTKLSSLDLNSSSFRYFTVEKLKDELGLSNINYAVFIHFESRTIVAEEGITIKGITYYISNNTTYYVDSTENKGKVKTLEFKIISPYGKEYYYTTDNKYNTITKEEKKYKIIVTPKNTNDDEITGGILKYKKATSNHWEIAEGLEFIITELSPIKYNVQYEDNDRNVITVTIRPTATRVYIES